MTYNSQIIDEFVSTISPSSLRLTELKMVMAAKIHDVMKEKNITKEQLAYLMDTSIEAVNEWLRGGYNFDFELIVELENELNVKLI